MIRALRHRKRLRCHISVTGEPGEAYCYFGPQLKDGLGILSIKARTGRLLSENPGCLLLLIIAFVFVFYVIPQKSRAVKSLSFDEATKEKYIPYIIESTYELDRIVLALLFEGLHKEEIGDSDSRVVLNIRPALAPIKLNILPLSKKRHAGKTKELYAMLAPHCMAQYEESGSIGKRYRRGDAIGIPYAITADDATLEQGTVTIRDRDTMEQRVLPVSELVPFLADQSLF